MCRAVLESGADAKMAEQLNDGIVYLMMMPYLLVGTIGFIVYRKFYKKSYICWASYAKLEISIVKNLIAVSYLTISFHKRKKPLLCYTYYLLMLYICQDQII